MTAQVAKGTLTLELLCSHYDALERACTPEELQAEMQKFAARMGFEFCAYALTINAPSFKPSHFIINGFPAAWREHYLARNYFTVDPVVQHACSQPLPIAWSHDVFEHSESEEFWNEARSHGLEAGLSFAVREHPGMTAIFSLARDKKFDVRGQDLAALIGQTQMFAYVLHQAVARIALPEILPLQSAKLTARELECLKWIAEGKTAWETARILGISERTAVFHINNVMRKLDAANRTQAIVRAVGLKLL